MCPPIDFKTRPLPSGAKADWWVILAETDPVCPQVGTKHTPNALLGWYFHAASAAGLARGRGRGQSLAVEHEFDPSGPARACLIPQVSARLMLGDLALRTRILPLAENAFRVAM